MSAARAVKDGDPAEARRLRVASEAARLGEHIADHLPQADVDAWAAEVAASLRPLTPVEAAAVGHLIAELDARLTQGGGGVDE
jgi:hypothetical protein